MAKSRRQRKAEQRKRREEALPSEGPVKDVAPDDSTEPDGGSASVSANEKSDSDDALPSRTTTTAARGEDQAKTKRAISKSKKKAPLRSKAEEPSKKHLRERSRVINFLYEVRAELRRVQWPDRQTLFQATAVVLASVGIAAVYLGALDYAFGQLVKAIL